MRHFDLTPLYRSTIGFDRLGSLLDTLGTFEGDTPSYPPYNIERVGENEYRISMAVAGFGEKDLSIEVKENTLSIRGEKQAEVEQTTYLHRGIAGAQLRAQVPACRPRGGQGREPRERLAARRSRARAARGDEAPHHSDCHQGRQAEGHRQQGRVKRPFRCFIGSTRAPSANRRRPFSQPDQPECWDRSGSRGNRLQL